VGDERAETYLRVLAESELRRMGDQLRRFDAAAGADIWSPPDMLLFATVEGAQWKVVRTARILVAAGALDQECLVSVADEFFDAIQARSRLLLNWYRSRGVLHRTMFAPAVLQPPPPRPADPDMRVTPIGRALEVASDRAPSTLHLMSLVATGTEALITVVMRMHWPPDEPSSDLEIIEAGPQHLPYDQLSAVDDEGTRYTVRFEAGQGETATWRGVIQLDPVPPRRARWLDLIGDGTRLLHLPLHPAAPGRPPAPPPAEPTAILPADRLLMAEAERILVTGNAAGPAEGPDLGEIITVLTDVGVIAAGNPLPGQLAALCQRLGTAGHGITVRPAANIPAEWASVVAHRDAPVPAGAPEMFSPLAAVLPDVDGAWIAVAGLSSAAGQSHLHLVSIGLPPVADRFAYNWTPGLSWWLADGNGHWHVGTAGEPWTFGDGTQVFRLRLTPPLTAPPDAAGLVLTGPSTRIRVSFAVSGGGQNQPPWAAP
jgi:hypothetical protein